MRRKATHISIILMGALLIGCGSQSANKNTSYNVQVIETVTNIESSEVGNVTVDANEQIETQKVSETEKEQYPRMVKLNDKIYADTGETSNMLRCGVMDFSFDSSVKEGIPTQNNQTNFGKGYEGQYGMRENRIEICIDGVWHIFAHNENNFEGVEMKVTENTDTSLTLEIYHNTDNEVTYGEDFSLEKWDEKISTWLPVSYKNADFAFTSEGICPQKGKVNNWSVDWEYIYGELEKGEYRIVKEFIDYKEAGENTFYTLTADFECE